MKSGEVVRKLKRWDRPFGSEPIRKEMVAAILMLPLFKGIAEAGFPDDLSPHDIIANDGRLHELKRGDAIYREGEYGSSVYVILMGGLNCVVSQGAKSNGKALPSPRQSVHNYLQGATQYIEQLSRWAKRGSKQVDEPAQDEARELEQGMIVHEAGPNDIVGLVSALGRTPRSHSAFASEHNTRVLELRWPGFRDLRYWCDEFSAATTKIYRARAIEAALRACPIFADLDQTALKAIAGHSTFQVFGDFLWSHRFQRQRGDGMSATDALDREPVIAAQGHYLDDLIVVHSGFARETRTVDFGEQNMALLKSGDSFGLDSIAESIAKDEPCKLSSSLRAVGYTEIVRIPSLVVETAVLDSKTRMLPVARQSNGYQEAALDFAFQHRFMNGTRAMLINADRCVNCDDCVRACASTHGGIARFQRRGTAMQNVLVTQACMHCTDPVCLIDCPTEAIYREPVSGIVVIDEATCIGCSACASACPYNNIQMIPRASDNGRPLLAEDGRLVQRAVKCDFCIGSKTGPACVQACPHDALTRMPPIGADDYLIQPLP